MSFSEGAPPLTKVSAKFSPQEYYSHITGFVPAKQRKHGSTYTVPNPWAKTFFRPHACSFDDIEKAEAIMGVLNHGTFPSARAAAAVAAALEWAVDAHNAGHDLSTLAMLMNNSNPNAVKITLACRHYWRSAPLGLWPRDALARVNARPEGQPSDAHRARRRRLLGTLYA